MLSECVKRVSEYVKMISERVSRLSEFVGMPSERVRRLSVCVSRLSEHEIGLWSDKKSYYCEIPPLSE